MGGAPSYPYMDEPSNRRSMPPSTGVRPQRLPPSAHYQQQRHASPGQRLAEVRNVEKNVIDIKEILGGIRKQLYKWSNIIKNIDDEERITSSMTSSMIPYLNFEMEETVTEWIKLMPQTNASHDGPTATKQAQAGFSNDTPNDSSGMAMTEVNKHLDKMQETIKELSNRLTKERTRSDQQLKRNEYLEEVLRTDREQLRQQKEENEKLIRLSKVTAHKLLKSNPNIADLSDANRPTKLGVVYSETYDNEYADSFGALCEAGYTEIEAVDTLRDTLLNTFEFCSEKSEGFLKVTEEAITMLFHAKEHSEVKQVEKVHGNKRSNANTLVPGQSLAMHLERERTELDDLKFALKWKPKNGVTRPGTRSAESNGHEDTTGKGMKKFEDQMKKLRKEIAVYLIPSVQKAYLKTRWDTGCIDELKPFIEKCIYITWMMNVQSPPMAFLKHPAEGAEPFDGGRYRPYTKTGDLIDYVVWPAMMLTKEGPIILKGIAQGKTP